MDQNARWEQLARLNEAAPLPAARSTPVLGRSALVVVVVAVVLFFLVPASGFTAGGVWVGAKQIVTGAGLIAGIALAVASLVRGERRAPAVTALCIVVATPLIVFLVVILAWSVYARSIGG